MAGLCKVWGVKLLVWLGYLSPSLNRIFIIRSFAGWLFPLPWALVGRVVKYVFVMGGVGTFFFLG